MDPQIQPFLQCSSLEGSHNTSFKGSSCPTVSGGPSVLDSVGLDSSAGNSLVSRWSSSLGSLGESSFAGCAKVVFSEGNLGRDLRSGFFVCGSDSLGRLLREALPSRLGLSGQEDWLPFCSVLTASALFWRPSFGDLGLVVGICITESKHLTVCLDVQQIANGR